MPEVLSVENVVVGAGVIGLSIARELAIKGQEVYVLERADSFGTEISSRNSEVIHAGLYYPEASLKATLCVEGRQRLYDYCEAYGVPHKKLGKLIVANSNDQLPILKDIIQKAHANGCPEVRLLAREELLEREPELNAHAAILSPETGIIDSHAYMLQLINEIEQHGGACVFNSVAQFCKQSDDSIELMVNGGEYLLKSKRVFNCCGLSAPDWVKTINADRVKWPEAHYAKGSYFSYSGRVPFKHLIYPVPEPGGLGTHLTLDMSGRAKFGPDVEWLDIDTITASDYVVDEHKRRKFYESVSRFWPDIKEDKLIPDYAGIRPKVVGPGEAAEDFKIWGSEHHGVRGLTCLFGIESPGLTASLAIAAYAVNLAIN